MELFPTPPGNDDDDKDHGKQGLVWDPAGPKANARLGPYTPAVVDYLMHPPKGYPVPGSEHPKELAENRRRAFEKLIDLAFRP